MLSKQNIPEKKEKIKEFIQRRGPSLPSSISSSIDLSLLFTSALLSEMHREGSIRMSHLKIGGSPLYLMPGQEPQLDNFTNHLEKKEQEALELLRKEQVLEDGKMEPSHRVALRNMRDFAIITRVSLENEEKNFWRLHTLSKEDFEKKLKELISKPRTRAAPKKEEKQKEQVRATKETKEVKEIKEKKKEAKPKKRKKKEEVEEKIKNYLESNNLSLKNEIKQDDVFGIVSSKTQLGSLNFLVIFKNKKKINDADITLALHEGQKNKMPVLLLTPGSLTKKAQKYVEENKGYLVIKNVNL